MPYEFDGTYYTFPGKEARPFSKLNANERAEVLRQVSYDRSPGAGQDISDLGGRGESPAMRKGRRQPNAARKWHLRNLLGS